MKLQILKFKILAPALIILTFCLVTLASQAFAQNNSGLNLTISPIILELSGAPGKKIEGKFRIRNNASEPLELSIKVDALDAKGEEGRVVPASPRAGDVHISWLTFDHKSFTAKPQEWTDVKYTLDIPKEAAFAYYYALRISQNRAAVKEKTTTTVLGEVVIPILLQVQREGAKREAKLLDFTPKAFISEYLPVSFTANVENTGNVHLKPRGNIFIRGGSEKDLGIIEVNPGLGNVLPGSKRLFESTWTDGFLVQEPMIEDGIAKLDKDGKPLTRIKINWDKITSFRLGKYTAKLVLVYDDGKHDVVLESSKEFWVIPYTAIGITLAGLIIVFFIIRLLLKAYVKQQIRKYQTK
jgi:hypothetical protein